MPFQSVLFKLGPQPVIHLLLFFTKTSIVLFWFQNLARSADAERSL
jgi:hypothetical protein